MREGEEEKVEGVVLGLIPSPEARRRPRWSPGIDGRRADTEELPAGRDDEGFPKTPLGFPRIGTQPLGSVTAQEKLLRTPWIYLNHHRAVLWLF